MYVAASTSTANHNSSGNWLTRAGWTEVDGSDWPGVGMSPSSGVFTVDEDGLYMVLGTIAFSGSTAGTRRIMRALKNGTTDVFHNEVAMLSAAAGMSSMPFCFTVPMTAGDTIEFQGWQNTGGNLAWEGTAGSNKLTIWRIGV